MGAGRSCSRGGGRGAPGVSPILSCRDCLRSNVGRPPDRRSGRPWDGMPGWGSGRWKQRAARPARRPNVHLALGAPLDRWAAALKSLRTRVPTATSSGSGMRTWRCRAGGERGRTAAASIGAALTHDPLWAAGATVAAFAGSGSATANPFTPARMPASLEALAQGPSHAERRGPSARPLTERPHPRRFKRAGLRVPTLPAPA